jgi:hypothetical protein
MRDRVFRDFDAYVRWGDQVFVDATPAAIAGTTVLSKGQQASAKVERPRTWSFLLNVLPQGFNALDVWSVDFIIRLGVGSTAVELHRVLVRDVADPNLPVALSLLLPAQTIEVKAQLSYTAAVAAGARQRGVQVAALIAPTDGALPISSEAL